MCCPVFETLLHGSRGGGKTDVLLMDFAQHVGKGFGAEWKGILFRRTYPELSDVVEKSKKWFFRIWPEAVFHETKHEVQWPTGERLMFRHAMAPSDYWKYHGMGVPWVGWEELTTWESPDLYLKMMSICRSSVASIPRKYRATTNPHGVGHNWVKTRFNLKAKNPMVGEIITDPETNQARVAVASSLHENKVLMHADPNYIARVASAAPNAGVLAAWLDGNWDVTSGGMFDDVWDKNVHVVPDIEHTKIPATWKIDRSYDHGQSRPFSVCWWAESDGRPMILKKTIFTPERKEIEVQVGAVRGDIILLDEWYGCEADQWNTGLNLTATEIAYGIKSRETEWGIHGRTKAGPADNSIKDADSTGRSSVAKDMAAAPNRIKWLASDKSTGSRVQGWQQIRLYLKQAKESPRTLPGLFICDRCIAFQETIPSLPRDEKKPDDVNTKAADHAADATRYRLRKRAFEVRQEDF